MYMLVGGNGKIGTWLSHKLREEDEEVLVVDLANQNEYTRNNLFFEKGNILNYKELESIFKNYSNNIQGVVNLASYIPYRSKLNPLKIDKKPYSGSPYNQLLVSCQGNLNILELCRVFNIDNYVYISSGAVYGSLKGIWKEDQAKPEDIYAVGKYTSELMGIQYNKDFNLDFKACRIMSVYGGTLPEEIKKPVHKVLWGPLGGVYKVSASMGADEVKHLTYIKDVISGIYSALKTNKPPHAVFNIAGPPQVLKTGEIINTVKKVLGRETEQELGPGCFAERYKVAGPLDLTRAREELGYSPAYDLESGIRDYIEWIKLNK